MSQTAVVWLGLLCLALVLALTGAVLRKRSHARAKQVQKASPGTRPEADRLEYLKRCGLYWGVSIRTRENSPCCSRVEELLGQPFPLDQAPRLPLAGCDLDCHCHYQPLLEQRDGKARRTHHDRRSNLRYEPDKKNRRQAPSRRK